MMAAAGVVNAPLHFYFNSKNKDVSFVRFLIASAAMAALFFPWLTLISGVGNALEMSSVSNSAAYGTIGLYMQTYCLLYKRSRAFVLTGLVVYMLALAAIFLAALFSTV